METPEFEQVVRWLTRTHRLLPLDEIVAALQEGRALPDGTAAITFDDGYQDIYTHAWPVLQNYKVPATVFLTTGPMDRRELFWFDRFRHIIHTTEKRGFEMEGFGRFPLRTQTDRFRAVTSIERSVLKVAEEAEKLAYIRAIEEDLAVDPPEIGDDYILTWDQVREMAQDSVTFGSHTVTHPQLTHLPVRQAAAEIRDSKRRIEEETGTEVHFLSYPNGSATDTSVEVQTLVKEAGYLSAFCGVPGQVRAGANPFMLNRVFSGWDFDTFKFFGSGAFADLARFHFRR
nr:polysaccharide deacetylase family protein [Methanofollis sp. W23]